MMKFPALPALQLNQAQKIRYTALVLSVIILTGVLFQYTYHARKIRYTQAIAGYYRQYFHREPDAIGLRHWVNWALNKWSLKKVERIAFKEVSEKETGKNAEKGAA